jgi:hypothetical protein
MPSNAYKPCRANLPTANASWIGNCANSSLLTPTCSIRNRPLSRNSKPRWTPTPCCCITPSPTQELLIVAVSRQAVRGYRVKVDPRTLENDLAAFRKLVAKPPLERTASERRKLPALGQRLYAALIKPAEPSLKNATTVLLCPEGALNQLPWGALIVAVDKQGRPTYWVERVALGITLSAGVYLQAKAVRPAPRGVAIAAVSQYQQQVAQAPKTAQLVRRSGRALGNLPAVKQEVAQLRRELSKLGVVIAQERRRDACAGASDGAEGAGGAFCLPRAGGQC